MRIVVTGALGHIGSRFIRAVPVVTGGIEFVMLDNLVTQRYCSLFDLPCAARYRLIEDDVVTANLDVVFADADAVVHLAAITDAASSFDMRERVERVNLVGTQRVAEACIRQRVPLVFVSTTSVYGPQRDTVDEDCPDAELAPQSPYAESKLSAERYLQGQAETTSLAFVTCRFGTIFGTSPGMRFHTAINKFCWQAVNREPVTVWRTAIDQQRPYLDLGDAVRALNFIIARRLYDGRVYNVVTANATVREIIDVVESQVPGTVMKFVDTPIMNQLSYRVSNRRFVDLGFTFTGRIAEGIAETINMLRALHAGVPGAATSSARC